MLQLTRSRFRKSAINQNVFLKLEKGMKKNKKERPSLYIASIQHALLTYALLYLFIVFNL